MTYDDLLLEADSDNLITKEKPLKAHAGRIDGKRIAIKKDISTIQKKCVLAEELGHWHTTYGDIMNQSLIDNRKQERRARIWAYNKLVGISGIVNATAHGCYSIQDMSDYLNVTEEFLLEAIEYYKQKYGAYHIVDNYMIFFEPLGVLELYG
ncbi:MAG: hypothetical protein RR225_05395 [Clostridium sp.]